MRENGSSEKKTQQTDIQLHLYTGTEWNFYERDKIINLKSWNGIRRQARIWTPFTPNIL